MLNGTNGDFSGWEAHHILRWLLLLAGLAPFILAWIIVRDHALSWPRGEMTAVVAVVALRPDRLPGVRLQARRPEQPRAPELRDLRRAARDRPDVRRIGVALERRRARTQAAGNDLMSADPAYGPAGPQPGPRTRAHDRGGGARRGAARRHGRQGGRRPGGRRRHALRARRRADGRHRGDRRGREGRGADALQRRARRRRLSRPRSTWPSTRSRARR